MQIVSLILIGLALSIDAVSLSISYALMNINSKKIITLSLFVGIFHFIMPIIGYYLGVFINNRLNIDFKYLLIIGLLIVLIEIIKSDNDKNSFSDLSLLNLVIFSFIVSIDSFSIAPGIKYITSNILLASSIFSITTFLITYIGFLFGKYLSKKFKSASKYIAIIMLFTLIIYYLCKH